MNDMPADMNILITNDDGYTSKGIRTLVEIMRRYGKVTVIAPKTHQSGMSVALTLGSKAIAYKKLGEKDGVSWAYVNGTPASCVKFALDQVLPDRRCDVVVCGINHGANSSVATNYSGTRGAAEEAAINGIPAIGVSLCEYADDADFSSVEKYFPGIFERLMQDWPERFGISYNVNFPPSSIPVKGVRICHQGAGHWTKELDPMEVDEFGFRGGDEGEAFYVMRGEFVDDAPDEDYMADHHAIRDGYVSIVPQTYDRTDYHELARLSGRMDIDF